MDSWPLNQRRSGMTQESEDDAIDRAMRIADDTFDSLLGDLDDASDRSDVDPVGLMFSLWINITHFLFECGWDSAQLSEEVVCHERMHHGQDKVS
jgi:hypothetical protein